MTHSRKWEEAHLHSCLYLLPHKVAPIKCTHHCAFDKHDVQVPAVLDMRAISTRSLTWSSVHGGYRHGRWRGMCVCVASWVWRFRLKKSCPGILSWSWVFLGRCNLLVWWWRWQRSVPPSRTEPVVFPEPAQTGNLHRQGKTLNRNPQKTQERQTATEKCIK